MRCNTRDIPKAAIAQKAVTWLKMNGLQNTNILKRNLPVQFWEKKLVPSLESAHFNGVILVEFSKSALCDVDNFWCYV